MLIESLAHHALNAALWKEAVMYLCQAGDKAVELSAYREAGAFFESALQALTHLPQDQERDPRGDRHPAEAAPDIRSDRGIQPARALPGRG